MLECLKTIWEIGFIASRGVAINCSGRSTTCMKTLRAFWRGDDANLLKPHPYALAESAVRGVVRDRTSQTLLVSGESGAGKTETVKIMLGYIAKRSHRAKGTSASPGVDDALIAANPLLEAFANATTVRNGNSSRFGKFVRVFVGLSGTGQRHVDHYLLENGVCLTEGERNFHVFYQCVGRPRERTTGVY